LCIYCLDRTLVSTFKNETQASSPFIHTMWLSNSSPSLWYRSKKSKAEGSHSLHLVHTHEHFQNPSCTKLVTA
jgi:hypothetical protein